MNEEVFGELMETSFLKYLKRRIDQLTGHILGYGEFMKRTTEEKQTENITKEGHVWYIWYNQLKT